MDEHRTSVRTKKRMHCVRATNVPNQKHVRLTVSSDERGVERTGVTKQHMHALRAAGMRELQPGSLLH